MVKIPNGPIWPLYGQIDFGCSLSSVCDPPSDHRTHTTPPPLSACNETAQVIAVTTFCDQVHGFMRLVCGAIEECQKNGKHKTAHWTDLQPGDLCQRNHLAVARYSKKASWYYLWAIGYCLLALLAFGFWLLTIGY